MDNNEDTNQEEGEEMSKRVLSMILFGGLTLGGLLGGGLVGGCWREMNCVISSEANEVEKSSVAYRSFAKYGLYPYHGVNKASFHTTYNLYTMKIFLDANGKRTPLPKNEVVSWRISGYALIHDHDKILVVVPTWNKQFELPGGGVYEKEGIKKGIIRECYEETGYKIFISDTAPFYVGEDNFYHRHDKKFYHSLIIVYSARLRSRKQNLNIVNTRDGDEIRRISWKDLSTFTQRNTHRIVYPAIQNFRQRERAKK